MLHLLGDDGQAVRQNRALNIAIFIHDVFCLSILTQPGGIARNLPKPLKNKIVSAKNDHFCLESSKMRSFAGRNRLRQGFGCMNKGSNTNLLRLELQELTRLAEETDE